MRRRRRRRRRPRVAKFCFEGLKPRGKRSDAHLSGFVGKLGGVEEPGGIELAIRLCFSALRKRAASRDRPFTSSVHWRDFFSICSCKSAC
jgi:hypothetical protein